MITSVNEESFVSDGTVICEIIKLFFSKFLLHKYISILWSICILSLCECGLQICNKWLLFVCVCVFVCLSGCPCLFVCVLWMCECMFGLCMSHGMIVSILSLKYTPLDISGIVITQCQTLSALSFSHDTINSCLRILYSCKSPRV